MTFNVAVIGGGPAGLYFGYLLKRRRPEAVVRIWEQNPSNSTFGFGVVFSDRALEFLQEDDEDTYDFLGPHIETWSDLKIVHRDVAVPIDGNGFAAIGRLELLQLFHQRCLAQGVEIIFKHPVAADEIWSEADLVVAADGVNSVFRVGSAFGTTIDERSNRFVWYGTSKVFNTLSLTFRRTPDGAFVAHHYRYSPTMSTFIVECDEATWHRAGFAAMSAAENQAYCEQVFEPDLEGHSLISNKSIWRQFPVVWNERWSLGNVVLLGDALRTCHFSIGSGTRLAMEDAIALDRALSQSRDDVQEAFTRFEAARRPPVETIVAAANLSAGWYERIDQTMEKGPENLAYDYMTRTGRVSDERLSRIAPRFMSRYLRQTQR